jgi:A/G-specific adenine glycosylase
LDVNYNIQKLKERLNFVSKIMSTNSGLTPIWLQKHLLNWFDSHGRKYLPWQEDKTPYRVWVSEIMLQQTQVATVIPYFLRFMAHFPDLKSLAAAPEDTVLHYWAGLGYYSRARNLHKTAKKVLELYAGIFPCDSEILQTLPGIGKSTAGAIQAIAFETCAPILDGNVKRVLIRLHGITEWYGEKNTLATLWSLAEKYTPVKRVADFTQAMMDLGATVCVRGKPACAHCPFKQKCVAHAQGLEKILPKKKPARVMPVRTVTMLILQAEQTVLLEKRAGRGVWHGLWSLPERNGLLAIPALQTVCEQELKLAVEKISLGTPFRHTFSHYHLDILPAFIVVRRHRAKVMEDNLQIWYNLRQPQALGLPAPITTLLQTLVPTLLEEV